MPAFSGLMLIQVQTSDPISGHDVHLLTWGVLIIALALVMQSLGLLVAAMMGRKLLVKLDAFMTGVESKTTPLLTKTNALVDDLSPKIRVVSENIEQISYTVRAKVDEIGETVTQINRTVTDINGKTRVHVDHVNGMVTTALNTTEEVSLTVQNGIRNPMKKVAGAIAGLKAGLETLAERSPFGKGPRGPNPYDL